MFADDLFVYAVNKPDSKKRWEALQSTTGTLDAEIQLEDPYLLTKQGSPSEWTNSHLIRKHQGRF
ncbi:hypothetical protein PDIDSM_8117 [Penicillium digitatum]|nr:hypothetical protein PDIDSM_8117 [Penicillium digitatum]